ncbi:MAG: dihydrolipoamide acetyltransferase family protein [Vicinamibacterales bacterium]|nr:dihydrolipoamide acetyltransferase family protein [Vicinamibacterales bacterium]
MPQMGESIAEGTVARWLKQVGDSVGRDEPLLEISTDKVDAEIPSPVAGVLVEIRVAAGEMAEVHSVVAVIETAASAGATASVAAAPAVAQAPAASAPKAAAAAAASPQRDAVSPSNVFTGKASPVARVMARVHGIDLAAVTPAGSRVSRADVEKFLMAPKVTVNPGDTVEPMTTMRRKIAEHMIASRKTSAHAHSVFLVNCGHVEALRKANKARYDAAGVKVSILPFVTLAAARALRDFPLLNASLIGDQVVFHHDINVGVAVALDTGLIVPVVKRADQLDVVGVAKAIGDLAARARSKQLKPEEVAGGTFTVTNPGNFGGAFATPIINQPQVAILELGTVEKRPAVVDDQIVVRPMMNLTLGFDHRLVDGALADQYLAAVKRNLETWSEE